MQRAHELIASGHDHVVDITWRVLRPVNHDILMGLLAKRVADKRILKPDPWLSDRGRAGGWAGRPGTPQGGPLSPLLPNLMLDVLDKELATRGLNFVRYADDSNLSAERRAGSEPHA